MLGASTAGWAIGIALVISASVAHGQSAGEASVRLNGVPVIHVTASSARRLTRAPQQRDGNARMSAVDSPPVRAGIQGPPVSAEQNRS